MPLKPCPKVRMNLPSGPRRTWYLAKPAGCRTACICTTRFNWLARLITEWTPPKPGLPLITGQGQDAATIFEAIENAIADLSDADAKDLRLKGLVGITSETYLAVAIP